MRFFVAIFALALCGEAFAQSDSSTDISSCSVSGIDTSGVIENSALRTSTWPDGRVVFEPGGPGFIEDDGSLGMKWPWERKIAGQLSVGGRRLDGEAPPARSYIPLGYGNTGFQSTYLVFPTPGCWEITGGVSGQSLSFTVYVEKKDEGPDWRRTGPDPHRRVTTHWQDPGVYSGAPDGQP
jgi:hypothetical protein